MPIKQIIPMVLLIVSFISLPLLAEIGEDAEDQVLVQADIAKDQITYLVDATKHTIVAYKLNTKMEIVYAAGRNYSWDLRLKEYPTKKLRTPLSPTKAKMKWEESRKKELRNEAKNNKKNISKKQIEAKLSKERKKVMASSKGRTIISTARFDLGKAPLLYITDELHKRILVFGYENGRILLISCRDFGSDINVLSQEVTEWKNPGEKYFTVDEVQGIVDKIEEVRGKDNKEVEKETYNDGKEEENEENNEDSK